jgi:hypothetical protein
MTGTRVVASRGTRGNRVGIGCLIAMLILVGAGVCPADIVNPSFESFFTILGRGLMPEYWGRVDHPSFNSYCTNSWATEGTLSVGLFNKIGSTVSIGNYQGFNQWVDLTDKSSIEFDVRLVAIPAGEFANFEASLLIGGAVVWRQTTGGVYLDQRVNVKALTGWHRLEIRNTALAPGAFSLAYWTQWDNLRLHNGVDATVPAVVTVDPGTLNLGSAGPWVTCYLELGEDYDVRTIDGATVTLNGIAAYIGEQGWATPEANEGNVADFDGDGTFERMVKFDRAAVQATVEPPQAMVTVQGRLTDGTPFEGTATIRVLDKGANGKKK